MSEWFKCVIPFHKNKEKIPFNNHFLEKEFTNFFQKIFKGHHHRKRVITINFKRNIYSYKNSSFSVDTCTVSIVSKLFYSPFYMTQKV